MSKKIDASETEMGQKVSMGQRLKVCHPLTLTVKNPTEFSEFEGMQMGQLRQGWVNGSTSLKAGTGAIAL